MDQTFLLFDALETSIVPASSFDFLFDYESDRYHRKKQFLNIFLVQCPIWDAPRDALFRYLAQFSTDSFLGGTEEQKTAFIAAWFVQFKAWCEQYVVEYPSFTRTQMMRDEIRNFETLFYRYRVEYLYRRFLDRLIDARTVSDRKIYDDDLIFTLDGVDKGSLEISFCGLSLERLKPLAEAFAQGMDLPRLFACIWRYERSLWEQFVYSSETDRKLWRALVLLYGGSTYLSKALFHYLSYSSTFSSKKEHLLFVYDRMRHPWSPRQGRPKTTAFADLVVCSRSIYEDGGFHPTDESRWEDYRLAFRVKETEPDPEEWACIVYWVAYIYFCRTLSRLPSFATRWDLNTLYTEPEPEWDKVIDMSGLTGPFVPPPLKQTDPRLAWTDGYLFGYTLRTSSEPILYARLERSIELADRWLQATVTDEDREQSRYINTTYDEVEAFINTKIQSAVYYDVERRGEQDGLFAPISWIGDYFPKDIQILFYSLYDRVGSYSDLSLYDTNFGIVRLSQQAYRLLTLLSDEKPIHWIDLHYYPADFSLNESAIQWREYLHDHQRALWMERRLGEGNDIEEMNANYTILKSRVESATENLVQQQALVESAIRQLKQISEENSGVLDRRLRAYEKIRQSYLVKLEIIRRFTNRVETIQEALDSLNQLGIQYRQQLQSFRTIDKQLADQKVEYEALKTTVQQKYPEAVQALEDLKAKKAEIDALTAENQRRYALLQENLAQLIDSAKVDF